MTPPLIKICGMTSLEDARNAIAAGADWLGFIFVPSSPRAVSLETAKPILDALKQEAPSTRLVGVFQNAAPDEIQRHITELPLDAVQLHGQEQASDFAAFHTPMIKVLLLDPTLMIADLKKQAQPWMQHPNLETFLLDLPKGSGIASILEWPAFSELSNFAQEFPYLAAGGLTPDNVHEIIRRLHPLGVDVASGVEQTPGQKDVDRMRAFCRTVNPGITNPDRGESTPCNH